MPCAAERRTTRCQARTDGPDHCDTAGCRGGHQTEGVIPASVLVPAGGLHPAAKTPATQDAAIGCAVIVSASPAASCRTNLALALMVQIAGGLFIDPAATWSLRGNPTVEDYWRLETPLASQS